jgi:hypothetical protein
MQKRFELGLPLIETRASGEQPSQNREAYEYAMIAAAREAGELALEDGRIAQAWPYFRAVGDSAPVRDAIERFQPAGDLDDVIAIAYHEGVHPAKGLELVVEHYGICRAITVFGMHPLQQGKPECIGLLVRTLHAEVVDRIRRTVAANEGEQAASGTLSDLIAGRDWLFGEYDYYVDTSHLYSVLPYCLETQDNETLKLFAELCDYGKRLSSMFQSHGTPPFDSPFVDYRAYVAALLGDDHDLQIAHFLGKAESMDREEVGLAPAEVLVNLLVRLRKYDEALRAALRFLSDVEQSELTCPSIPELCSLAGAWKRLESLAREQGDLLNYVAASAMVSEIPQNHR